MKSVLRVLTAVALLVLVGSATAEEQEILHSVTAPQIQSMLGELGFTGNEVDEDGDVIVMMQGHPVVILVGSGNGRQVQMVVAFLEPPVPLERINQWNRDRILSKAYLDRDGDTIFEADLDLDGGVTRARVKDWLRTFNQSMTLFMREILNSMGTKLPHTPTRSGELNV